MRAFVSALATVGVLSLSGLLDPSSASAATLSASASMAATSCILPAPITKGNGDWMQWTPTKHRQDVGQDTFASYSPRRVGNDLNWYASPGLGMLYTRVVYKDAAGKGKCHLDGKLLVQYDVKVVAPGIIDPQASLTRAVVTVRPGWTIVGIEMSRLIIQPTGRYYAEWEPAGNRTQVTATPTWFVEHNSSTPTMWKVGNATQLHWVVNAAYHPFVTVRYTRAGVTHVVTDKTLSRSGTLDVLLPSGSTIVATVVQSS